MTGFLTLNANPTNNFHAATKQYVDNISVGYVNVSGDTMTGFLTLNADPTSPLHAVTKQYVDNISSGYVDISGDTMTGFLTLNADPTSNLHAATKQYVDNITATLPYDFAFFIEGILQQDKIIGSVAITRTVVISVGAPGSIAIANTASSGTYTLDIIHAVPTGSPAYAPTVIGQITFNAGVLEGSITFNSEVTLSNGDMLQIKTDSLNTPDLTLRDLSITLVGCADNTGC